jgi:L-lactate permease
MGVMNAGGRLRIVAERTARTGRSFFFFAGMGAIGARCYVVPSGWTCHS